MVFRENADVEAGWKSPVETMDPGLLRVAAFAGFPPFVWSDGGKVRGRDIRFLEEFATSLGLEVSVEFFGFSKLWEVPGRGLADVAASGLSLSMDRRGNEVSWTLPYSEVRRTAMIRAADRRRYRQIADFEGSRFAVVPDSAADSHARKALPPGAELVFCTSLAEGVDRLLEGRVDAVGTGSVSASYHLGRHPGVASLDLHGAADEPEFLAFAVGNNPRLHGALNAFISARKSGHRRGGGIPEVRG